MINASLKYIPSNKFSYCDLVLDITTIVKGVASRYGCIGGEIGLDIYFYISPGNFKQPTMDMTK
jgi:hypothetical protein